LQGERDAVFFGEPAGLAQQRAHGGEELAGFDRVDEVGVRAHVEADAAVAGGDGGRRDVQDREPRSAGPV
jgi:hypothetical protein